MMVDRESVSLFAESLRSRGKQPATVESYCRDAQRFLDYLSHYNLPVLQVEPETLVIYQQYLLTDCEERHNSVRRTVIGIRQFFRFLTETRRIASTPFDLVPIPARDERLPSRLDEADVEALISVATAGSPACKASRDLAIVGLLAFEGLKANELIHLLWSDFIKGAHGGTLRVQGNRARAIRLHAETGRWIQDYRELYEKIEHQAIVQAPEKRMFVSFKGRDAASPLPIMSRHGLKFILYELGEKAGLHMLNTELLRHYAVAHLIAEGRAAEEIMLHLGLRRLGNVAKHLARADIRPATNRKIEGASHE